MFVALLLAMLEGSADKIMVKSGLSRGKIDQGLAYFLGLSAIIGFVFLFQHYGGLNLNEYLATEKMCYEKCGDNNSCSQKCINETTIEDIRKISNIKPNK